MASWVKVHGDASAPATPLAEGATDWVKAMAELNQRTEGWVYEVPAYEVAALKKRMAEITKKPEAAPKS